MEREEPPKQEKQSRGCCTRRNQGEGGRKLRLSRSEEAGETLKDRNSLFIVSQPWPAGCLSPIKFYWHTALFVQASVAYG